MNIGEKIKIARRTKKLTQAELVGDKITRNMLSVIESGKASPSLDTINFIAERLNLPVAYFFSDENDLFNYRKIEKISAIKSALNDKNYTACISLARGLDGIDGRFAVGRLPGAKADAGDGVAVGQNVGVLQTVHDVPPWGGRAARRSIFIYYTMTAEKKQGVKLREKKFTSLG